MAEMDWTLPTGLDKALTDFYEAPQPDPGFADRLQRRLASRQVELLGTHAKARYPWHSKPTNSFRSFRSRPSVIILAILLSLLLVFGVAYTIAKLAGYLPGYGFIQEAGKVYVLGEPVEITRGGVMLRVDKAVSDKSVFWVELTVLGLPEGLDSSRAFITLPGGEKIQSLMGSETSSASGESHRTYSFPPLDGNPQSVMLLVENLGGQDFSLPLTLRRLEAGEIIPIQPAGTVLPQSNTSDGVTLLLDHVAYANDKTILQVSLRFDQPDTWVAGRWQAQLTGPDGSLYPLLDISPGTLDDTTRIYQTVAFTGTEQLTLTLKMFPQGEDMPLFVDFSAEQAGFTFDLGADPQVGQEWELDQVVKVGNYTLHAVRARATSAQELVFDFEHDKAVTGLMLFTPDPLLHGGAAGLTLQNGNVSAGLTFDKLPTGPLEVRVVRVYYTAHGPWQIHWQPQPAPLALGMATPTAGPTLEPYTTPTLTSSDPFLVEMQSLLQKFDAPLQQGPAWIHIVSETTARVAPGQVIPPAYVHTEQWYEIDAQGYIVRSVSIDRDADGQILQQSASVGNYAINFTTGDGGLNDAHRYRLTTDELVQYLNQAASSSGTITRQELPCEDGRPCIVVTMQESFPKPITNPGEEQAFWGAGRQVWVDSQTGQQVKFQSFWLLEDGSKLISSTKNNLLVEKVASPPQEILDILAKVVVP
jgi:hypothetical protein